MKLKVFMLVVCLGSALIVLAGNENMNKTPFNTVQEVFAALSVYDLDKIKSHSTEDFQLLEVGEVWDFDVIENIFKSSKPPIQRRNWFSVIKEENFGDVVWISYWNRAEYTREEGKSERAWLESAVLVKQAGEWKLQMLHSTRIEPEQLPKDIQMQEYISQ